ncbi:MAG: hypothetical protein PHO80_04340 [Candidatus Gracilibacteria bacterium]|nr:hypothetical protein [Candidatus Gracilibacteria bacterium]MDD4530746.1 hypothetical protein [Candidatus Gracilibacteria bacterium]
MKEDIILPSWELVNKASLIKKYYFIPAFIMTVYLTFIVAYQTAYTYINIFGLKSELISWFYNFIHQGYFYIILISAIVMFITYIFIIPIAEGGVITLIDAYYKKDTKKYTISSGISGGLLGFLKIFEYINFTAIFRPIPITTFHIFLLRMMSSNYLVPLMISYSTCLFFSFFINTLFAYTKIIIILEDLPLFKAMSKSVHITINNLAITFKLYLSIIIVNIRILITVILMFIFPFLISVVLAYFSTKFIAGFFIIILLILFFSFFIIMAQVNSVVDIFIESLWYKAYMLGKEDDDEDEDKK